MSVTLRSKKNKKGTRKSLYLDYYEQGKRKTQYLKLYIQLPPYKVPVEFMGNEKIKNKYIQLVDNENLKNLRIAEKIKTVQEAKILKGEYGIQDFNSQNVNFINFYKQLTEERFGQDGNYGNWHSSYKYLIKYCGEKIKFGQLNARWLDGFKHFLINDARTKCDKPLSKNSQYSYFNKLKCALKIAYKREMLSKNIGDLVNGIPQPTTMREYLTEKELTVLKNIPCEAPVYKSSFLFCCASGLRFSDVSKMKWSEIQYSNTIGWHIRFYQKKTGRPETLPINQLAIDIIGSRGADDDEVFKDLKYSAWNNTKLQNWVYQGGIKKRITFHCSRHSYATLLLSEGNSIETVSDMLGHKNVKTTQIYTNIINENKIKAAHSISF
jgi:integrase